MTDTETPSPRRRAVFLDVDGTYAVFGAAPAGHVAAVRAARDAGHLVFLCTGRPMSMVPAHLLAAGFDGVVAAGGAYAVLGDEVLLDIRFPADLAARTVEVMDSYGVTYLLEAPEAVYTAPGTEEQLRQAYRAHLADAPSATTVVSDILASVRPVPAAGAVSFAKVSVVVSSVPVEQLGAEVGEQLAVLPSSVPALGEEAGEIFLADVHKAVGMDAIVRRLGLAREDVIGFGDGLNDLEMLEYAGVGVAIEGSHERLLAVADRTAAGPEVEGLVQAFAELGLP